MVSYVQVQGRLTQDPQVKQVKTVSGMKEVYELSLASNNYIAKKTSFVFYNVTLWPGRAERLKKSLTKGSAVVVTGQFYQNTYTDNHNNKKQKNCINLHSITLPVCDHPVESSTEFESLDDNAILNDSNDSPDADGTETPKTKRQRTK